jgi:hypothetical protein
MTDARMDLPPDVRIHVDVYLDAVRAAQMAAGVPSDEAAGIRDDLRAQIYDMLSARAAGRTPAPEDVQAVLAQLEPPEAFGPAGEAGADAGAPPRAAAPPAPAAVAAPPLAAPPGPPKPKFCRTALLGLLGFLPMMGFCVLLMPLAYFGCHVLRVGPGADMAGGPLPAISRMTWLAVCAGLIPLAGMLWTTVCGIAAIVQIRRAAGQLTGLWLAVFDAVVFPIIVFVILVAGVLSCA